MIRGFKGRGFVSTHTTHPNVSFDVKLTCEQAEGCVVESLTARTIKGNAPKRAYYVTGSGYEMGFLTGLLVANETA